MGRRFRLGPVFAFAAFLQLVGLLYAARLWYDHRHDRSALAPPAASAKE